MIDIKVEKRLQGKFPKLLKPTNMLDSEWRSGTVFQQWSNEVAGTTFYITCGHHEKRVVSIWWCDEDESYLISTDNKKDLKNFNSKVRVVEIKAEVDLRLVLASF